jgi:hypothetical protein
LKDDNLKRGKMLMREIEKEEFRKMIKNADDLYEFMEKERLGTEWKHDSERFMGLAFIHTATLVRESISLSMLTIWLIVLTIGLAILTLFQIIIGMIGLFI